MFYYVTKHGNRFGPFSAEELSEHAQAGDFAPDDLLWDGDTGEWAPIGSDPRFGMMEPEMDWEPEAELEPE